MKSQNLKRPKVKGTKRPYMPPPRATPMDKSIKAYMKRLRQGKA